MTIRARARAGLWAGLTLSVAFAVLMVPAATIELFGAEPIDAHGHVTGPTVRLPEIGIYRDLVSPPTIEFRRLVFAHGETVDAERDAPLWRAFEAQRRPPTLGLLLGLGIGYLLMALLFTAYLRNYGHRGTLLRTQLVLLASIAAFTVVAKLFLLLTALPVFLFPLGALSMAIGRYHSRQVAFATTVVAAMAIGSLVPFDLEAALVLLTQGLAATMALRQPARRRQMVVAGVVGGMVASAFYVAICFLVAGHLPVEDALSPGSSGLLAALGGGVIAGLFATAVAPALAASLGHLSRAKLLELADLNHPLLRQIAEKSPGTWSHSLAMANMAEVAATSIGADALLTRVGAYYHDLGKSLAPGYFIENLPAGEPSPHDRLTPAESARKIFLHTTSGVELGRKKGVPEPVLDFMHMHHGNGLLEYFFHKNQELGNPDGLTELDFRYPGLPPQTRETAILAICDAVEAASRTLREPDERSIEGLVQRIVFGKLRLGQLDESGLTSSDLKLLSNSLIDTLKNSFHVRIEYPWQKEERLAASRASEAAATTSSPSQIAVPDEPAPPTATQRLLIEPRLDSTDVPRPGSSRRAEPRR